jgi:hypothetical protein
MDETKWNQMKPNETKIKPKSNQNQTKIKPKSHQIKPKWNQNETKWNIMKQRTSSSGSSTASAPHIPSLRASPLRSGHERKKKTQITLPHILVPIWSGRNLEVTSSPPLD